MLFKVCWFVSLSPHGLQTAITRTYNYFSNLDLSINPKKTKVMIFNLKGLCLDNAPENKFWCGSNALEVAKEYTYLGLILKPSGTFTKAVEELYSKASRSFKSCQ